MMRVAVSLLVLLMVVAAAAEICKAKRDKIVTWNFTLKDDTNMSTSARLLRQFFDGQINPTITEYKQRECEREKELLLMISDGHSHNYTKRISLVVGLKLNLPFDKSIYSTVDLPYKNISEYRTVLMVILDRVVDGAKQRQNEELAYNVTYVEEGDLSLESEELKL